jgi:hypothetical protein
MTLTRLIALLLSLLFTVPTGAAAQGSKDVWRDFIAKVDIGTELDVHLQNGQHFKATLLGTRDDAVLLQPKTRVTVPVQAVPFDAIARLGPRRGGGMGAGKAALIGIASGAATFLAIVAIVFATIDD